MKPTFTIQMKSEVCLYVHTGYLLQCIPLLILFFESYSGYLALRESQFVSDCHCHQLDQEGSEKACTDCD